MPKPKPSEKKPKKPSLESQLPKMLKTPEAKIGAKIFHAVREARKKRKTSKVDSTLGVLAQQMEALAIAAEVVR